MEWVLYFDGDCAFCSRSAQLVARVDQNGRIGFASLQGARAKCKGLSDRAGVSGSMVLEQLADGRMFERSDAVIELARALGGIWRLLALGKMLPRSCRDAAYDVVARHRHRFMGRNSVCLLDQAAIRDRWLD